MRHPIDDIFKKGLANQEHSTPHEEWLAAKAMLDLEKRKKRIPIWWFGIAASILLITMVIIGLPSTSNPDNASIDGLTNLSTQQKNNTQPLAEKDAELISVDSNNESTNSISTNSQEEKTSVHSEITNPTSLSNSAINNQSDIAVQSANRDGTRNTAITVIPPDDVEMAKKNISTKTSQESQDKPSKNSDEITTVLLNPNLANRFNVTNTRKTGVNTQLGESLFYLTHEINKLEVPFELPIMDAIVSNDGVVAVDNPTPIRMSMGMYASYAIPYSKPSLGLMLNSEISNNWVATLGVGVAYRSRNNNSTASELGLQDTNGFIQESMLDESSEFKQFSVEVPLSIGYRLGRHSIAAIGLAELNLWSELKQSTVIRTNDTQDLPSGPTFGNSSDPITITQDSKTVNEPTLSVPKYYIGIGYGYQIGKKVKIQTQALWNATSVNEDVIYNSTGRQSSTSPESRWHLRTTFLLSF